MSFYHQSLMVWVPGSEVQALASLWMGVETITPVVLNAILAAKSRTRATLADDWGVSPKLLDAEVRRRVIFNGNEESYRAAKSVSDGLEHGFESFTILRRKAPVAFFPTANALRKAILTNSGVSSHTLEGLLAQEYSTPFPLFHSKVLFATLEAPSDHLSKRDQLYPYLDWRSTMVEVPTPPEEDPGITFREQMKLQAAKGVKIGNVQVRAGVPRTQTPSGG